MPLTPLNASDRRCHGAPGLPGITDGTQKSRFLLVSALWKSIFCNLCTSVQSNFFAEMLLASVAAPRLAAPTASPFPSLLRGPPWWRRVWCFGGTSLCSCCLWLLCTPIIPVFQICTVKIIKSSSHQWKPTALSVYLSLCLSLSHGIVFRLIGSRISKPRGDLGSTWREVGTLAVKAARPTNSTHAPEISIVFTVMISTEMRGQQ